MDAEIQKKIREVRARGIDVHFSEERPARFAYILRAVDKISKRTESTISGWGQTLEEALALLERRITLEA